MQVILSSPRGFCAGVVRAIEVVELCLKKYGAPMYVKHQIVHNPYVVASLEVRGALTVEDVDEIPLGSRVVFSAHGSPPEDFQKANLMLKKRLEKHINAFLKSYLDDNEEFRDLDDSDKLYIYSVLRKLLTLIYQVIRYPNVYPILLVQNYKSKEIIFI